MKYHGELSRENMISSQAKIICYLHIWNDHRSAIGLYNKSRLSQKKLLKWNGFWYFIGVYIINRTLHERFEIQYFSSRLMSAANEWNIIHHSKRNFISPRGHVISSIFNWSTGQWFIRWIALSIFELPASEDNNAFCLPVLQFFPVYPATQLQL